jgi:hypothetical protein
LLAGDFLRQTGNLALFIIVRTTPFNVTWPFIDVTFTL